MLIIRIILGITGVILLADGIFLLASGKIHLGIILPILIGLIFIVHAIFWKKIQSLIKRHQALKKLWQISWGLFSIWLISLIGFFAYIQINKNNQASNQAVEAIIVLGSGLVNGQPSPTLQARLDRAAQVYKTNTAAHLIVTGGIGIAQQKSEAEVMSHYLKTNYQIPSQNILLEDQSTSTELNLLNSQKILQQQHIGLNEPIAIVTSDFHTIRARAIARKQGYQNVFSYSSDTPLETRYNAWLREYFAYISGWVLQEY